MRLHVGVVGTEQRLGALDGERLRLVDELAAAVVALAGVAFRVLVGQHRTLRPHDSLRSVVLRSDQFDMLFLATLLQFDRFGKVRVEGLERAITVRSGNGLGSDHRGISPGSRGGERTRCYLQFTGL